MHEHDHDLIMALAEGTLPDAEVRTVEAAVAACATCTQELALQQQALHALATATPPRLDDLERQRLRRAVAAAVDLTPVVAPAPQRRRWNIPAIGVAVAAVLVTALAAGPLVNLLSTSGSNDSAGDFAAAATTTTTTQSAALSAPSSESEVGIAGSPSEEISESSGLSDQSYFDATRESAPNLGAVSDGSLDDLLSKVVEGDPAAAPWVDEDATIATSSRDGVPDCALAVATSFASVRYTALIGTGDAEGAEALVYSVGFEDGSAAVAAVDAATCELVRYRASSRAVTPLGTPQD